MDRHPPGTLPLGFAARPGPEPAPRLPTHGFASEPHERDRPARSRVGLLHECVVRSPPEVDRRGAPPDGPGQTAVQAGERGSELALDRRQDEQVGGTNAGSTAPKLDGGHPPTRLQRNVFLARRNIAAPVPA